MTQFLKMMKFEGDNQQTVDYQSFLHTQMHQIRSFQIKQDFRDQMTNELTMLMASPSNFTPVPVTAEGQMYPYQS